MRHSDSGLPAKVSDNFIVLNPGHFSKEDVKAAYDRICSRKIKVKPEPVIPKPAKKKRLRQSAGPNKTEKEFEHFLDWMGHVSIVREGLGLRLGNGVVYWPDYVSRHPNTPDHLYVWEVKGFFRDDAAVKLKVAASLFPEFSFVLTWKDKSIQGGFSTQTIYP